MASYCQDRKKKIVVTLSVSCGKVLGIQPLPMRDPELLEDWGEHGIVAAERLCLVSALRLAGVLERHGHSIHGGRVPGGPSRPS